MPPPKIRHLPLGTVLETNEEPALPVEFGQTSEESTDQPVLISGSNAPTPSPSSKTAALFRPTQRPPMALLTVCDDGRSEGELIRIRGDRFIIGRTEGDLRIPHDDLISARHAELTRVLANGGYCWVVTDLQSTNGLFARVSRLALSDQDEFLVGLGRYRFEFSTDGESPIAEVVMPKTGTTRDWTESAKPISSTALVELVPGGIGNRYVLTRTEYWIGTDVACTVCRRYDPFCEPRHVRVFRDSQGKWYAEHQKTKNGLWLRVPQLASPHGFAFQIGEQRFRLKVGG